LSLNVIFPLPTLSIPLNNFGVQPEAAAEITIIKQIKRTFINPP
jgi:hypothetical protein